MVIYGYVHGDLWFCILYDYLYDDLYDHVDDYWFMVIYIIIDMFMFNRYLLRLMGSFWARMILYGYVYMVIYCNNTLCTIIYYIAA